MVCRRPGVHMTAHASSRHPTCRTKKLAITPPELAGAQPAAPAAPRGRTSQVERYCVCLLLQYLLQSCSRGGGGDGGHVLRETTSRGLCELVCPSRTNERGGEGYCVKEGGGEEGERERERAGEVRLHYWDP